jgi:predicted PurR-regulated permease PerM
MHEGHSDLGPTEPSAVRPLPTDPQISAASAQARVGWTCLALGVLSLVVVRDFVATVVLASWFAIVLWSWREKLVGHWNRPGLVSTLLTAALLFAFLVPLGILGASIGIALVGWSQAGLDALKSGNFNTVIDFVLGRDSGAPGSANQRISDLIREGAHSLPQVLVGVGAVLGVVTDFIVKVLLFVVGVYSFLVHGRRILRFIDRVSPFSESQTQKLIQVYAQTGKGMLVGVFLVMLVHGVIAGIGYLIIGIPRALELGGLTAVASLVPAIGTGIVWIPITLAMAVTGQVSRAIATLVLGLAIGGVDNLVRPWLSKLGEVPLNTFPLFVAIFGGVAALGPSGLLLGPLVLALAKATAELYMAQKEQRRARALEFEEDAASSS